MTRKDKGYEAYKKLYKEKKKQLKKKGFAMADTMLNKKEWHMVWESYKEENPRNVNRRIVTEQSYEYSDKFAKNLKRIAKEKGLDEYKGLSYTQIRKGAVDISKMNEELKSLFPDWTGAMRAAYFSHEVFGS